MLKGIAVSPGVAVGTAYCVNQIFLAPLTQREGEHDVQTELARYDAARRHAEEDLLALERELESQLGTDEAAIFKAHHSILCDPALVRNVRAGIVEQNLSAPCALHRVLEEYTEAFSKFDDAYLKERLADIRDVVLRIEAHLAEPIRSEEEQRLLAGPLILVADELLPSQAVGLGAMNVKGIVTQSGSRTSHAAIVARSRGIPAVSGVQDVLHLVRTGDTLVVDGREGRVIINPDSEACAAYLKLEREFFDFQDHLAENRHHPAMTADGVAIELLANINCTSDAEAAAAMGASGVGLFRTEYLYLRHPAVPGEEEQLEEYRAVIQASPHHSVTIRSLDLGGDKTMPFLGHIHREANPFMGWRSIRLCFEHPNFLNTQLRAVMRAAAVAETMGGEVRLMFPMITTLEEIHEVKTLVRRAKKQLREEGQRYADVPLGMMLEVPAAAISIRPMLKLVDFVSIGSNDLVQYLMAADRDNPKVAHLCQPLAPPILIVLKSVIEACREAGKPVTLCGEMAGQPTAFALLLGMGLRSFSMSPAFVPYIKEFAKHLTIDAAEFLLEHALTLQTTGSVRRFMTEELRKLIPDFDRYVIA
jgi:phosphoenolpyruvate-protein phosphotransferase (PTS system enzyme I)